MDSSITPVRGDSSLLRQLREEIAAARADVRRDEDYWARLACAQDTEEAEESGRLPGYLDGLERALALAGGG